MSRVAGWWKLLSWKQKYDDGRVVNPFGDEPVGRLTYSDTGDFSVLISRPDKPHFTTGSQWNAEDHEKAKAYDGIMTYFGHYELSGETMSHHVEASSFPNWEGHTQTRTAVIEDDVMTLSARLEESTSEARTVELIWQRIAS